MYHPGSARMGGAYGEPGERPELSPAHDRRARAPGDAEAFAYDFIGPAIDGSCVCGIFRSGGRERLAHVFLFGRVARANPRRDRIPEQMRGELRAIVACSRPSAPRSTAPTLSAAALPAVGYRQWVLSFGGPMAQRLGHDQALLAEVAGALARAVMHDMPGLRVPR